LQNMFIAQLVLQGFYICCASSGTTIKKSWSFKDERKNKNYSKHKNLI
jgi:hypothetical protein